MIECGKGANDGRTMDFQGRYQILNLLSEGEARTFRALQTSSGRIVLLHQLWGERTLPNQPDLASLVFGFLRNATAEEMKSLVDMGEDANLIFVVTEDVPECLDLRQWLQSVTAPPGTGAKASEFKPGPSDDSRAPGKLRGSTSEAWREDLVSTDATQLFATPKVIGDQTPSSSVERRSLTPTRHPDVPVGPRTSASSEELAHLMGESSETGALKASQPPGASPLPSKKKAEPGEFTRSFSVKDMPLPEAAGSPPPPPETPSASPGEKHPELQLPTGFEGVFQSRKQQPPSPAKPTVEKPVLPTPSAPHPEEKGRGEFTRIFYGRDRSEAPPPTPMPPAEIPGAPPIMPEQPAQSDSPDEFSRLFHDQQVGMKSPAPSVESKGPGEFTLLFQAGAHTDRRAGPSIPGSSPRPPVPLSSPSSQQGPGEFTRLIQGYQAPKSEPTPLALEQPRPLNPPPPQKADEARPGEFTMLFQHPPQPTATPMPAAPARPVVQTPLAAPQLPEADEYARMFERPGGGSGAPLQGAPQTPPPGTPPAAAGRGLPMPVSPVQPPVAPGVPYVQPSMMSLPVAPQPQPYQIPPPQFQQPTAPPIYAVAPQPVIPQVQPTTVPAPMAPQAGPPETGKNKFLVPLIILAGLFIIAVGLILFFALKH